MNIFVVIAIVLGVLWALGLFAVRISSPLIHLILVVAVIVFLYDLLVGRRS